MPVLAFLAVALAVAAGPAHAYIGPGVGAGAIAVVFGVLGSVLLALVAVLWYPLKRLIRRGRKPTGAGAKDDVASHRAS
jgi:uncharacterized membrane protein